MTKRIQKAKGVRSRNVNYMVAPAPVVWVLAANRVQAVLFQRTRGQKLRYIERFIHPEGRRREQELVSDKPGRVQTRFRQGVPRHAYGKERVWHERAAAKFAKELMHFLKVAHSERRFDELVVIAEPHFLGILRDTMPAALKRMPRLEEPREIKYITTERVERRAIPLIREWHSRPGAAAA